MRTIIFRTDGNAGIGAGHIMRCLSIGEAAREMGMECVYITADGSFAPVIRKKGFQNIVLGTRYSDLDSEIGLLEGIFKKRRPDLILIDSYYVTKRYLERMMGFGKTAYLDDVRAFPYPADFLVNYNIYAEEKEYERLYSGSGWKRPHLLLGTKYVPLRKEFRFVKTREIEKYGKNILISTGGADPEHMALGFLKSFLCDLRIEGEDRLHFVISSLEPDKEELKALAVRNERVIIHENVERMSALMAESDLAVAAAGSTLYELAACGIPTITYVMADNQAPGALGFEACGIMSYAGDCRTKTDFFQSVCGKIERLRVDEKGRKKMSVRGREIVDGRGAERILREILHFIS